jgi:hypothetical protein
MGRSLAVVFGFLLLVLLGAGVTVDFRQVPAAELSGEFLQVEQPHNPVLLNAESHPTFHLYSWYSLVSNSFSEHWAYSLITTVFKESRKVEIAFSVRELVYPFHGFW